VAACTESQSNVNLATNKANNVQKANTEPAATIAKALTGQDLYTTNCMTCHKDSGKGGRVTIEGRSINPEDLTEDKLKKADDVKLVQYINEGFPDDGMPAFKDKLTTAEIEQVVKHIRTLQGK
jgi:mono/diheme cytochrome c family protein